MGLYEHWCDQDGERKGRKRYLLLTEKGGGRDAILTDLGTTVRSHYDCLDRIADDVDQLGFATAAAILRERLPTKPRSRAGDLGEILASELAEEMLEFKIPVRRMRFKDGREVPLRGDDFIGVIFCEEDDGLWLLKGECKSRKTLDKTTITEARAALNGSHGRCTPLSLLFVADQLLTSDDEHEAALGRLIRNEVGRKTLAKDRIDHALFTLSGNGPIPALQADFEATDNGRHHSVINLHIEDYSEFLDLVFDKAADLGDG
jgi:hypothetical protein